MYIYYIYIYTHNIYIYIYMYIYIYIYIYGYVYIRVQYFKRISSYFFSQTDGQIMSAAWHLVRAKFWDVKCQKMNIKQLSSMCQYVYIKCIICIYIYIYICEKVSARAVAVPTSIILSGSFPRAIPTAWCASCWRHLAARSGLVLHSFYLHISVYASGILDLPAHPIDSGFWG